MTFTLAQKRALLDVARAAIRGAVCGAPVGLAVEVDAALRQPAGCFVTLHERGAGHALRGCVGNLAGKMPLVETVRATAVNVLSDPRFEDRRIREEELGMLEIEISVLSPLQAAATPLDFDLLNDGIYLTYEERTGCFLPQVAQETGWSKEQLLARLCTEKMGLAAEAWRDPRATLQTFTVTVVGPELF